MTLPLVSITATVELTAELFTPDALRASSLYAHYLEDSLLHCSPVSYTLTRITMAVLDLHYIWALGHAVTVACSCMSSPPSALIDCRNSNEER